MFPWEQELEETDLSEEEQKRLKEIFDNL